MNATLDVPMWAILLVSLICFVLGHFVCSWHSFLATRVLEIIEDCEGKSNKELADSLDKTLKDWGDNDPGASAVGCLIKRLRKL